MYYKKFLLERVSVILIICVLCIFMIGGAVSAGDLVTFADQDAGQEPYWPYYDDGKYADFGFRFSTKSFFEGGMIFLYGKGTAKLTVSLYRWNNDFSTSIAGTAAATTNFTADGGDQQYMYRFPQKQAAGEYVVVFHVAEEGEYVIPAISKASSVFVENYVGGTAIEEIFLGGIVFAGGEAAFNSVKYFHETVAFFDTAAAEAPVQVKSSVGIQFAANAAFDYIKIGCPSWSNHIGSLKWTLYPWKGSYYSSIESSALASEEFIDFADGAQLYLKFDDLAAGEYLLHVENTSEDPKEQVGLWGVSVAPEHMRLYIDGEIEESVSVSMYVNYKEEVTNKFGTLSTAKVGAPGEPENPVKPDKLIPSDTGDMSYIGIIFVFAAAGTMCAKIKRRRVFYV